MGDEAIAGTIAQVLYDFDGIREDNLKLTQGEFITIMEMNQNGWWKGSNAKGDVGIFPYNYVKVKSMTNSFPIVEALYDYSGSGDDQLSFKAGDRITVMKEVNGDWSIGRTTNGNRGMFPLTYVKETGEEDEEAQREETMKWEEIERKKKEEAERLQKEREELEKRLAKEREEAEKRRQQEEERKMQEQLKQEAEQAKAEAARLKLEKEKQEVEIKKAQMELETLRAKAEAEKREAELKLQQEAIEARRRAEMAERELEQARAETALLRKKQEVKDARKSVDISKKLKEEQEKVQHQVEETQKKNEFGNPKRAPKPKKHNPFAPVYIDETAEMPVVEVVTPPEETGPTKEEVEIEQQRATRRQRNKGKVNSKFAHLGKGGEVCKVCSKSVGVASRVKALGGVFHVECFTCSTCSKILRLGDFVDHKGEPYCRVCHKNGFGIKGFGFGGSVATTSAEGKGKKPEGKVVTESLFKTGFTLERNKK